MSLPSPYPTLLAADPAMEVALGLAFAQTQATFPTVDLSRLALSITTADALDDCRHAGLSFGQTYYSASLVKVAAMYAAFELRAAVNALGSGATSGPDLFARCRATIDPEVVDVVPAISAVGIPVAMRVPHYEQIFATIPVDGGGVAAEFSAAFSAALHEAIVPSSNAAAATVIKSLGYSWINGTLAAGGFFFPTTQDGLWLAGTYLGDQPYVRIPSINDGPVAQAASTFDLCNLYAHLLAGTLVNADSSARMLALLEEGARTGDPSFIDASRREGLGSAAFTVTHTKIGLGPLKTGQIVVSEGTVVRDNGSGRQFIVVYQNAFNDGASLQAVAMLVERTIANVLTPVPTP